jgi:hypothetical protein
MPFNAIHEYDAAVAGNNTDIGGSNIAEGCAPSGINNALRELARQVRAAVANQGSDIASATTTNIGAATGQYVRVTGATTITGFGTVNAGTMRWVEFTGALTLTHNASSLKLPAAANIATAAGDVGLFVSLGAGNWKCLYFSKADGSSIAGFTGTLTSTDAGAAEGPDFIADRNSASPAASDVIGGFVMRGRDSAANVTDYARVRGRIIDAANGSEDGAAIISAMIGGFETDILAIGPGMQLGSPTGGDQGSGTINVDNGIYKDGVLISSGVIQKVAVTTTATDSTAVAIPADNTVPLNTEGKQLFSQSFTPRSASSTIVVEAIVLCSHGSTGADLAVALFKDAGANAIAVGGQGALGAAMNTITLSYTEASGSTSARTYALRYGAGSATMFVNRTSTGAVYGGVQTSIFKITEYL